MKFELNTIKLSEIRDWMKNTFEKDYNDLSEKTKECFKEKYNQICEIILKD